MCDHYDFKAKVSVARLTDDEGNVTGYSADVTVHCANCGLQFKWIGCEGGSSPDGPRTSFDETELRAPIRPSCETVQLTH